VQVADGAVRDRAHTAKGAMVVAVHLTPKGTNYPRLIQVLHHNDLWTCHARHIAPVLAPLRGAPPLVFYRAGLDYKRDCITHHRPHLRHKIARFLQVEAIRSRIVLSDLFPTVVNGWSIPSFKAQQFAVR